MSNSVDQAIAVLNRALEADPDAMRDLVNRRVECNEKLASDESIQVGQYAPGRYRVGLLGIVNGLFGIGEDGYGHITLVVSDDGVPFRFVRTKHTMERRQGGTP